MRVSHKVRRLLLGKKPRALFAKATKKERAAFKSEKGKIKSTKLSYKRAPKIEEAFKQSNLANRYYNAYKYYRPAFKKLQLAFFEQSLKGASKDLVFSTLVQSDQGGQLRLLDSSKARNIVRKMFLKSKNKDKTITALNAAVINARQQINLNQRHLYQNLDSVARHKMQSIIGLVNEGLKEIEAELKLLK